MKAVIKKGETDLIKSKFKNIPKGWQKKILIGLKKEGEVDILEILEG